jgi:hypothetical protein
MGMTVGMGDMKGQTGKGNIALFVCQIVIISILL